MAWTWQTAVFFCAIAATLGVMGVLAISYPSIARMGVLQIPTTRGDRLFITLLGTAFIHLAWIALTGADLWWASLISLAWGAAVFRWV
jgi:predicted small integral membrane protein